MIVLLLNNSAFVVFGSHESICVLIFAHNTGRTPSSWPYGVCMVIARLYLAKRFGKSLTSGCSIDFRAMFAQNGHSLVADEFGHKEKIPLEGDHSRPMSKADQSAT